MPRASSCNEHGSRYIQAHARRSVDVDQRVTHNRKKKCDFPCALSITDYGERQQRESPRSETKNRKHNMNRNEAWNLSEAILALAKITPQLKGVTTDIKLIEDMQGNVTEGIVWIYLRDARAGNGTCHEFRGRVPLTAEIIATVESMQDELVSKAKAQRAEARAIRADAR